MRAARTGGGAFVKHRTHPEWHRLFNAVLNETCTPVERQELAEVLKANAEARQLWFLYCDNECGLAEVRPEGRLAAVAPVASQPSTVWMGLFRPLTTMAAGLVIGMLSASMVFAYVMPRREPVRQQLLPLADPSFEAAEPIPAKGIPAKSGMWSGDFCRIVGAEQGIVPRQGKKMLRFLRSDNEETEAGAVTYVGEAAQVIDLRPFHAEIADGAAAVELSAWFQSIPAPAERYEFAVKAAAFHGEMSGRAKPLGSAGLERELCHAVGGGHGRSANWQQVSTSLTLPPTQTSWSSNAPSHAKARERDKGRWSLPGIISMRWKCGCAPRSIPSRQ